MMFILDSYMRLPSFPGKGRGFCALTQAFPSANVLAIHLDGVRLHGPAGDRSFMYAALLKGNAADLVAQTIRRFPANTTFIDIGAHIGCYTILAAQRFPKGRVYAVEPQPAMFCYLACNAMRNDCRNVTMCCAAVASPGQRMVDLHFGVGHSGGASLSWHGENTVSVLSIDRNWFSGLAVGVGPLLVKIDVEGSEASVTRELLRSELAGTIDGILVEISRQLDPNALASLMDDLERSGLREVDRVPASEADNVLFERV